MKNVAIVIIGGVFLDAILTRQRIHEKNQFTNKKR